MKARDAVSAGAKLNGAKVHDGKVHDGTVGDGTVRGSASGDAAPGGVPAGGVPLGGGPPGGAPTGGAAAVAGPADPVEEYTAALTDALHGPARAKARMVEEIRGGLEDTVAAYVHAGVPGPRAAREAVREFGSPDELVPSCQRELTIAQARHTARVVVLAVPLLIACWWMAGRAGSGQDWLVPRAAHGLAVQLAAVAGAAALVAATTPAVTGVLARRLPVPRRLPLAVAWAGTTVSVAMAVTTLALAVASVLAANWPLTLLAGSLAAVSHAVVASSARACRRCARLTVAGAALPAVNG
ncbi:permease prefix domain 1-containing protein [Streptomyces sp. NPDC048845]|uniref:permease prefix domain 1-containing protein n=1 Tax=Streptomyces sp. NPDC048845 TaxID=3155390 RepID=UPI00343AD3FB